MNNSSLPHFIAHGLPGATGYLMVGGLALLWLFLLYLRSQPKGLPLRLAIYPVVILIWLALFAQRGALDPSLREVVERVTFMGLAMWTLLTGVWLLGSFLRNHSIMDIAYPLTPWAGTVLGWLQWGASRDPQVLLLLACATVWAWRLSGYLAVRYLPHGEEARYARWRERGGSTWWWWSYFQIYLTQGVLVWLWTWPLALAIGSDSGTSGWTWLALAAWLVGFGFEALGDWQMHRFRTHPANKGQVMDRGLWAWCRHPNYFGEAMIWLAYGLFALATPWGWLGLPMVATVFWFMNRGSALSMTERYMLKTKPGYADYMARTPAFFPRPPVRKTSAN